MGCSAGLVRRLAILLNTYRVGINVRHRDFTRHMHNYAVDALKPNVAIIRALDQHTHDEVVAISCDLFISGAPFNSRTPMLRKVPA